MQLRFPTFQPPIIAHRGARSGAPENTLAAFRLAYQQGARWIETDVKLTQDGIPVLFHDDTLDRTTNGKGALADISWADLQNLDAGSWFGSEFMNERVPSLAKALRFLLDHGMRVNLEIKPCSGRTQVTTMVALMETAKIWPEDYAPPLISSFDPEALAIAAQLHPDWPRGLLLDKWRGDWHDAAHKLHANAIHMNATQLTRERIGMIIRSGLPVLAYTVNEARRAKELLEWGVSAVFSDSPKDMIQTLYGTV